jgi:hypothetical protein
MTEKQKGTTIEGIEPPPLKDVGAGPQLAQDSAEGPHPTQDAGMTPHPILLLLLLLPFILAALLKPRFLDANPRAFQLNNEINSGWSRVMGLIIICLTVLSFVALATRQTLLDAEKILLIQFSISFATLAWIIVNNKDSLETLLEMMELDAIDSRDHFLVLARSMREGINHASQRLKGVTQEEVTTATAVLRSLGPLSIMFLRGERNIFKIAFTAAGVAGKAASYFSSLKRE